jgi:acetyl esterase/lipase
MRANMEAFSRGPDADVTVSAVSANGIPCEWVAGPSPDPWRVVLYLHGGGYVMGSLNTHRQLAGWISKAAGARVLNVDYRLAPEHRYPAAVDDAVAAYEWLLSQGVAPSGIVVGGDSAGGGLTAATLLAIRNRRLPMPAGGVLLSPWSDLTGSSESLGTRGVLQPGGAGGTGLSDMAKQYVGSADPRDPLASPVYADLAGLPPLLIQVGTDEGLFDDSIRLDAAARTAAVEVEIEAYNGQGHVFQALAWSVPEAKQAIVRIGEWVRAHTAQS